MYHVVGVLLILKNMSVGLPDSAEPKQIPPCPYIIQMEFLLSPVLRTGQLEAQCPGMMNLPLMVGAAVQDLL